MFLSPYQAVAEIEPLDLCVFEGVSGYVPDGAAPDRGVVDQVEVVEGVLVELFEEVVSQEELVDFDGPRGVVRVEQVLYPVPADVEGLEGRDVGEGGEGHLHHQVVSQVQVGQLNHL